MTSNLVGDAIVAGVDAPASALQAASWAANEAALRRLPLRLVHGVHVSAFAHISRLGTFARFFEALESEGRRYLADARDMVRDAHPGLNVDIDLRCADPLTTLIELSETALTSGLCVATPSSRCGRGAELHVIR